MINFRAKPFSYLPLNSGDLFDLTCEYTIFLIENFIDDYTAILEISKEVHQTLPNTDLALIKSCYRKTDALIDQYNKLVKCIKLSLGEDIGRVRSKNKVLDRYSYVPNTDLQFKILHGFRNTQQHFEERLQHFDSQLDPFFKLAYSTLGINWDISFGSKGLCVNSTKLIDTAFDEANLLVESYRLENNQLLSDNVKIKELLDDVNNISDLLKQNISAAVSRHPKLKDGITPPAPKNGGVHQTPNGGYFTFSLAVDDE